METVWIFGDQLNRGIASLEGASPGDTRILMVESQGKLRSKRWHRQRLPLVVTAMRRFAAELEQAGFEVDYRKAATLAKGLASHRLEDWDPADLSEVGGEGGALFREPRNRGSSHGTPPNRVSSGSPHRN